MNPTNSKDVSPQIHEMLLSMGIPCHFTGFHYLSFAISLVMAQTTYICHIPPKLYQTIAEQFGVPVNTVSPVIHFAIRTAFENPQNEFLFTFFPVFQNMPGKYPSNVEFIATVTDRLRIALK